MFLPTAEVPQCELDCLPPRSVILAAHPDDEAIGVGGLLPVSREAWVLFLTDGAPRDRRLRPPGDREAYASQRRLEAFAALETVGVPDGRVRWLGGVDQESTGALIQLVQRLREWLLIIEPSALVTHAYEGGHPDHDTAAVCAWAARELLVRERGGAPPLFEMTGYHARDGRMVTGAFLQDGRSPEYVSVLSPTQRLLKRYMIAAYASQTEVLEQFRVHEERLRLAPRYDFSQPPHHGSLFYELQGWTQGATWRNEIAEALLALGLGGARCASLC